MQRVDRVCRYGHGALELLMGWFALVGVNRSAPDPSVNKLAAALYPRTALPNQQMLALRVWRCPTCGYVELVDDEV